MKTNVGIVKSIVSERLINSFMRTGQLNESKTISSKFFDVMKNSPYLQLEFKIINNLENKYIKNDVAATRYIDKNIELTSTFTTGKILEEYKKLEKFTNETIKKGSIKDANLLEKTKLYESISNLIVESKKQYPDVDLLHESFEHVLNHITTNKPEEIVESESIEIPENIDGDMLIEVALNKFTEKYSSINEDEYKLINKLASLESKEKNNYLEEWKNDIIKILEHSDMNGIEDKINESIQKVKDISYDENTFIEKISKLYEFKKSLS